jgi:predicted O-methyltransferase YrrM
VRLSPIRSVETQDPAFFALRQRTGWVFLAWALFSALCLALLGREAGLLLALLALGFLLAFLLLTLYHRLQAEQMQHYWQLEALASLQSIIRPRLPFPPMRLWAASPDFLVIVLRLIRQYQPQTVVELGSGVSSLISAYTLEGNTSGQLISLDHEAEFAQITQETLQAHQLDAWGRVIHAPLHPMTLNGQTYNWYDAAALAPITGIDLLIVDGPPSTLGTGARFPALPMLYEKLNPGAFILIDDAKRPDDSHNVEAWLAAYPLEVVQTLPNEKGAIILRKPPGTALEAP